MTPSHTLRPSRPRYKLRQSTNCVSLALVSQCPQQGHRRGQYLLTNLSADNNKTTHELWPSKGQQVFDLPSAHCIPGSPPHAGNIRCPTQQRARLHSEEHLPILACSAQSCPECLCPRLEPECHYRQQAVCKHSVCLSKPSWCLSVQCCCLRPSASSASQLTSDVCKPTRVAI